MHNLENFEEILLDIKMVSDALKNAVKSEDQEGTYADDDIEF